MDIIIILLFQQFAHIPHVICNPRSHRRRDPQGLVNAAKVVKSEPARNSGPVVLEALAKRIGQTRETAKAHARAQVAALDNRSADAFGIGLPEDCYSLQR